MKIILFATITISVSSSNIVEQFTSDYWSAKLREFGQTLEMILRYDALTRPAEATATL